MADETRTLRAPFFNYVDEDGKGRTLLKGQEIPDDLPDEVVKKGEEFGAFSDSPQKSPDQAAREAREAYLPLDLEDYDGNGPPDQPKEQAVPEDEYDDSPGEPGSTPRSTTSWRRARRTRNPSPPAPSRKAKSRRLRLTRWLAGRAPRPASSAKTAAWLRCRNSSRLSAT